MRVYCITGCRAVDHNQLQEAYFLTKKEAFANAREWTAPSKWHDDDFGEHTEGDSCDVTQMEIPWPVTRKILINLLNHERFAIRQEPVWRFERGRLVKNDEEKNTCSADLTRTNSA